MEVKNEIQSSQTEFEEAQIAAVENTIQKFY